MTKLENDFETEILSIVAHDMKTPVSAAKGFLDLVDKTGPLNDTQQRFADKAMTAINRIEELVTNILDYVRLEGGVGFKFAPCDVAQMIHDEFELLHLAMESRGIKVHIDTSVDSIFVHGDGRFLARVISNLLSNAVKYNRDDGEIFVRAFVRDATIRIDIQDTGMGVNEDDLPHIFDQFYRASAGEKNKIDGTGIGLAICKMIIDKHNGEISVDSTEGVGSIFTLILPKAIVAQGKPDRKHRASNNLDTISLDYDREEIDAVDDNKQESAERANRDSSSEEV